MIGVSPDSCRKHQNFKRRFGLTYTLISDADHAVAEAYGVWKQKSMFGKKYWGNDRTTFLIDATGKLVRVWEKVNPLGHAKDVLEAVEAL